MSRPGARWIGRPHASVLKAVTLGSRVVSVRRIRVPQLFGRAVLGGLLAALAVLLCAGPSAAHSEVVATDPADKSQVSITPAAVSITFNESVLSVGTRVRVAGPDGNVSAGATTVTKNVVRQSLSPDAPAGHYTVQWRVTSDDGHPVSGEFTFTAARGAATAPASPAPSDSVTTPTAATTTTSAPSAVSATSPATGTSAGSGTSAKGLSGITVIGIAAVVLVLLMAAITAIRRITRNRT